MSDQRLLRVFISSPSDVRPERLIVDRVVQRLAREFCYHFRIEAVLWEREPLVASEHFQATIIPPHATDITVVILWSRLGVLLPDEYRGRLSDKAVTGTEWEFEDALGSYREKKLPDLLLYRKTAKITGNLDDEMALLEALRQKSLVEEFLARWTRSADGRSFTAASWPFDTSTVFEELVEHHLRELIHRRLTSSQQESATVRWHQGSPFRGLQSFELEHAAVFFGRTHARNELRELLARQAASGTAFVLVMGASGSGKSSLVKAGLMQDLRIPGMIGRVALCRYCSLRPGDSTDMVTALAHALLQPTALPELDSLGYSLDTLCSLLRGGTEQVSLPIRQGLGQAAKNAKLAEHAESRLLLIIDQFEEVFTREDQADLHHETFFLAIEQLAKCGFVWVVATMRSDFFNQLEKQPRLLALTAGEARYLLSPPEPAEIAQMIRQPAREAGLQFETNAEYGLSLDEVILQAAQRDLGVLPLLSFLLDQLWQTRDEHGFLRFEAYERLGGLEGSLGRRADEVFNSMSADVQSSLPKVLRELVTSGRAESAERRVATARSASFANFPEGTPQRSFVNALLDPSARLLVASSDGKGGGQFRLAHEALLTHWEAARKQIDSDLRDLQLRVRLEESAQVWLYAEPKQRASLVLQSGLPLREARDLVARWPGGLNSETVEYISVSRNTARRRVIRLVLTTVGAILSLPTAATLIWLILVWRGVNSVERGLQMQNVPGGCYMMGSPISEAERDPDEGPIHQVCLAPFSLAKLEINQKQWGLVMLTNPAQYKGPDLPVENVSWDDAQKFIHRMNLFGSGYYRLPSESEWEYADRSGSTLAFPWGSELAPEGCKYANINDQTFKASLPHDPTVGQSAACTDGFDRTAPVGSFRPNLFGIYDMQGNIWEYVEDEYHASYQNAPIDGSAWTRHYDHVEHVLRGGSWHSVPRRARSAQRDKQLSDYRIGYIGFRLAGPTRH